MKKRSYDYSYFGNYQDKPLAVHAAVPKIRFPYEIPKIFLTPQVYQDMCIIIRDFDKEIGWLGIVEKNGTDFLIKEIFVPKQFVTGATTEITPEGLADLSMKLISTHGSEVISKIRFWGHSHVHMGVNPSHQDERQLKSLSDDCPDFFIRGIFNKLGRAEFSIFLIKEGIIIDDVEWGVQYPEPDVSRVDFWKGVIKDNVENNDFLHRRFDFLFPRKNNLESLDFGDSESIFREEGGKDD